ncbi:hypothetical protein MKEN_01141200 [Mycena kentingensis (nom. inval.)]|nr:hypothetical protein MKEN_01141200 [Mycena kentingensis (nom. inval.)]
MPSHSVKITGIGIAHPEYVVTAEDQENLVRKYHESSPALEKVLAINRKTGIETRTFVRPAIDLPRPESIKEVSQIFLREGLKLSLAASKSALAEAGLTPEDITHVVATTCTNSSNPGFDTYLSQALGLRSTTEKVLLHGVGCAGGLAALRLAGNLCHTAAFRGARAHVLVVACEITSTMQREELARISSEQQVRIGVTLFGDGAGAVILSLDGAAAGIEGKGIYELANATHLTVPDTFSDLQIDVSNKGFVPTLSARIPAVTAPCAPPLFSSLLKTLPPSYTFSQPAYLNGHATPLPSPPPRDATEFDWALHPGGAAILSGIEKIMQLEPSTEHRHTRASWEVYKKYGNTSSVSVLNVLDTLRLTPGREWVVSMAFGPGVTAEGALLRRID